MDGCPTVSIEWERAIGVKKRNGRGRGALVTISKYYPCYISSEHLAMARYDMMRSGMRYWLRVWG